MRNVCSVTDPGERKSESDLNCLPRPSECYFLHSVKCFERKILL